MNLQIVPGTDTLFTALVLTPAGEAVDTTGWTLHWESSVGAVTDITDNLISVLVDRFEVFPVGWIGADWYLNVDRGDGYVRPLLSGTFSL